MSLNLTGNNLIPYPYYAGDHWIVKGITYVSDKNGVVTANGTATDDAYYWFANTSLEKARVKAGITYTLSGCPEGGGATTYHIGSFSFGHTYDYGQGVSFTPNEDLGVVAFIRIKKGITVENLTFKPMLNKGTKALTYEPYKSINPENIRVNMSNNLYPVSSYTLPEQDNNYYTQTTTSLYNEIFQNNVGKPLICSADIESESPVPFSFEPLIQYREKDSTTNKYFKINGRNLPEDITVTAFLIRVRSSSAQANGYSVTVLNIMLNKGTTALPYEKYIAPKDVEKVVVANSPNLIPYPFSNNTSNNGITATYNDDGSVTLNGTATGTDAYFWQSSAMYFKAGITYTISGCPEGGSRYTYALTGGGWIPFDTGEGSTFTPDKDEERRLTIFVRKGTTVENLTFKPMLVKGTKALPYQKYDREVVWSKNSGSNSSKLDEFKLDSSKLG